MQYKNYRTSKFAITEQKELQEPWFSFTIDTKGAENKREAAEPLKIFSCLHGLIGVLYACLLFCNK